MPDDPAHLQLAFAYLATLELVGADAHVGLEELAFVHRRFPLDRLVAAGFVDGDGRTTPALHEARARATLALPARLSLADKLALLALVADASAADGVLSPEEADALSALAQLLDVADAAWMGHLATLFASGALRRDATGAG
ncbi:MAG: hypothetical protein ABMB14_17695 [Myxococcota bacterium]